MKEVIIADSGGSKTDWVRVHPDGSISKLSTRSYHPALWNEDIQKEQAQFWSEYADWHSTPLYFFGSGCFQEAAAVQMRTKLMNLGFAACTVRSDVEAAALATLGDRIGWVSILGTGSVLIEWDGKQVVKLYGGKGHQKGDEGSGFYFGKLVHDAFLTNRLSPEQECVVKARINLDEVAMARIKSGGKQELASFSQALANSDCFVDFHKENIGQFLQSHNEVFSKLPELHFVGSYAWHTRAILKQLLEEKGLFVGEIIEKPIDRLLERIGLIVD